jgi:hypothetical protein
MINLWGFLDVCFLILCFPKTNWWQWIKTFSWITNKWFSEVEKDWERRKTSRKLKLNWSGNHSGTINCYSNKSRTVLLAYSRRMNYEVVVIKNIRNLKISCFVFSTLCACTTEIWWHSAPIPVYILQYLLSGIVIAVIYPKAWWYSLWSPSVSHFISWEGHNWATC